MQPNAERVVFGDGFIPFHFSIIVDNPDGDSQRFKELVENVRALKTEVRKEGVGDDFPSGFRQKLRDLPGVLEVFFEGPYSSIVIPLCMVRSLGNCPVRLSGVLGTGPIADAIQAAINEFRVDLEPRVISQGDSPLELSVRDNVSNQKAVRIYPVSRSHYRHAFRWNEQLAGEAKSFVLSRYNKSRATAFKSVFENGGLTSLRVSETSRYVSLKDYVDLLPFSRQVVVSYRTGVMRQLARHFALPVPARNWPQHADATVNSLATELTLASGQAPLVALVFEREVALWQGGLPSLRFRPPSNYDTRSRAARVQGACAAFSLDLTDHQTMNEIEWEQFGERVVQSAYAGTLARPSTYPTSNFEPEGTWRVSSEHTHS